MVRGEDLDAVEPATSCSLGRVDERLDDLDDLGLAHRMAAVGVVVRRQGRRRPGRCVRVVEVAVLAHVVQLLDHHGALAVAGIGDRTEAGYHAVVADTEVATGEHRCAVHGHRFDDDHRRTAASPLEVVAEVAFAGQAVDGHVRGVGAEHDTVAQRDVSELQRLEQVLELVGHDSPPVAVAFAGRTYHDRDRSSSAPEGPVLRS